MKLTFEYNFQGNYFKRINFERVQYHHLQFGLPVATGQRRIQANRTMYDAQ